MSDLVEFLLARLDEDEAAAKAWLPFGNPDAAARTHIARHDPARVLREAEAKRRMLDDYATTCDLRESAAERIRAAGDRPDPADLELWGRAQWEAAIYEPWVRLLALPHADHPDYLQEWSP